VSTLILFLILVLWSSSGYNTQVETSSKRGEDRTAQAGGASDHPQSPSRLAEDILWWFPQDTETVTAAGGPYPLTVPGSKPRETLEQVLRGLPLLPLFAIRDGQFAKQLAGRSVLVAIEASRRFRSPRSLGLMPYEGCSVIMLQDELHRAQVSPTQWLRTHANKVQEIHGYPVALFEEELEEDQWRLLVAVPKPNLLLCATSQSFLSAVLSRMQKRGERRALPDDLPEWRYVDLQAPFWAVRHYDRTNARDDPSSPLANQRAANVPDRLAIGLVCTLSPAPSGVAEVRYLSSNTNALRIAAKRWKHPTDRLVPAIQSARPGVVEIAVPDSPETVPIFTFVLMAALGHAVYV
jgi:hypothetical protein